MYLVLFAVGLLITAAGLLTIGFGIPINAFSLGNTLIISGTVAVVGGLIMMGLGAAIRQLNRISVALNSRPLARPAANAIAAQASAPVCCRTRRRHTGAADRPHSASASAHSAEGARPRRTAPGRRTAFPGCRQRGPVRTARLAALEVEVRRRSAAGCG